MLIHAFSFLYWVYLEIRTVYGFSPQSFFFLKAIEFQLFLKEFVGFLRRATCMEILFSLIPSIEVEFGSF